MIGSVDDLIPRELKRCEFIEAIYLRVQVVISERSIALDDHNVNRRPFRCSDRYSAIRFVFRDLVTGLESDGITKFDIGIPGVLPCGSPTCDY